MCACVRVCACVCACVSVCVHVCVRVCVCSIAELLKDAHTHTRTLQDLSVDRAPVLIRIGSTAVSSLVLVGEDKQKLWCGCGKAITVLCTE